MLFVLPSQHFHDNRKKYKKKIRFSSINFEHGIVSFVGRIPAFAEFYKLTKNRRFQNTANNSITRMEYLVKWRQKRGSIEVTSDQSI